mgnify:CR=1 FL=1
MGTIKINKSLQNFLEKEGILEAFIENAKEYAIRFNIEGERHIGGIASAFRWKTTRQGYGRWYKIDCKWNIYKRKNGIE